MELKRALDAKVRYPAESFKHDIEWNEICSSAYFQCSRKQTQRSDLMDFASIWLFPTIAGSLPVGDAFRDGQDDDATVADRGLHESSPAGPDAARLLLAHRARDREGHGGAAQAHRFLREGDGPGTEPRRPGAQLAQEPVHSSASQPRARRPHRRWPLLWAHRLLRPRQKVRWNTLKYWFDSVLIPQRLLTVVSRIRSSSRDLDLV